MMNVNPLIIHKKVLVVGASGMAGQAFMRELMLLNNSNPRLNIVMVQIYTWIQQKRRIG